MNSTFITEEPRRGVVTISIVKEDYAAEMEANLRKIRKDAKIPGFRPGQAPKNFLLQKFGISIKADAIDKIVGEELYKVIQEHNVNYIGNPVMVPTDQDITKLDDLTYTFRLALMPETNVNIDENIKLPFYSVKIDDKLIDDTDQEMRRRMGSMEEVDKAMEEDSFRGLLVELGEDGMPIEGGLRVEDVMLFPNAFASDEEKAKFADANLHQVIRFNPFKADGENDARLAAMLKLDKEQALEHKGDFNYEVEKINHFVPASLGEEFYKKLFGEETEVKDEAAYREELKKLREEEYKKAALNLFTNDFVKYIREQIGTPVIDDETFRPFVLQIQKENKEEVSEESYKSIVDYVLLTRTIRDIAMAQGIELTQEEVLNEMRNTVAARLASYGYGGMADALIDDIAKRQLEEGNVRSEMELNATIRLLSNVAFDKVTREEKEVSLEEFEALFKEEAVKE